MTKRLIGDPSPLTKEELDFIQEQNARLTQMRRIGYDEIQRANDRAQFNAWRNDAIYNQADAAFAKQVAGQDPTFDRANQLAVTHQEVPPERSPYDFPFQLLAIAIGVVLAAICSVLITGCSYEGQAERTIYVSPDFTDEQRAAVFAGVALWNNAGAYDEHSQQLLPTADREVAGRRIEPRYDNRHLSGHTRETVDATRRWFDVDLYAADDATHFAPAAAHELGHTLGMEHVAGPAVMQGPEAPEWDVTTLQPTDWAQFCALYRCAP